MGGISESFAWLAAKGLTLAFLRVAVPIVAVVGFVVWRLL